MSEALKNGVYGQQFGGEWIRRAECAFFVDDEPCTPSDVSSLKDESRRRAETIIGLRREFEAFKTNVHDSVAELAANTSLGHEEANQFLDELGLDRLATEYEWTISVTLTGTAQSTMTEDDLSDWMAGHVAIEATAWTDSQVTEFQQDSYDIDDLKVSEA